jgi:mannose-6-phosphate isomerase-like protein (cupin superfamily)
MVEKAGAAFEFEETISALLRDGSSLRIPRQPGPPARVDGFVVGALTMTRDAPHGGEMHPDGDELLLLFSGRVSVALEEETGEREVELAPGQGFIVPRGVWHRVRIHEPSQLVHVTPGPGGMHRPLAKPPQAPA